MKLYSVAAVPVIAAFMMATTLSPIMPLKSVPQQEVVAAHSFSLSNRYGNEGVNSIYTDNILLTLYYLRGEKELDWNKIRAPFHYEFDLKSGRTFAYHAEVLPEYEGTVDKTTNAHFGGSEGFKSDGYLMGNGVCHLASLINWVARDAGLNARAPINHGFAQIPGVPYEYGVSIYTIEGDPTIGGPQNLYIINNRVYPVTFIFDYDGQILQMSIKELK